MYFKPFLRVPRLMVWMIIGGFGCGANPKGVEHSNTRSAGQPSKDCFSGFDPEGISNGYPSQPVGGLPDDLSLESAYCAQSKVVHGLKARMGQVVGYKVGFTGAATQTRFGVTQPVTGVLLEKMFLPNGATVQHDFAHRPFVEPDLMVVVSDRAIMNATNRLEVAGALRSIHACLELPALQIRKGEKVTGAKLVALNVGVAHMVMGPGIPVEHTQAFVDAVAEMETVFVDGDANIVQKAPASNLMGHPFDVLLWLINDFKRRGLRLEAGDRISLGSVGRLYPVGAKPQSYVYRLDGLSGGSSETTIQFSKSTDFIENPMGE